MINVEALLGLPITMFPELEYIRSAIERLGRLYNLYDEFLRHQQAFTQQLWTTVDLKLIEQDMTRLQELLNTLPSDFQKWHAFQEMKELLSTERQV